MIVLVLAVDTSSPIVTAGAVALLRPDELVAELERTGQPPAAVQLLAERTRDDAFGHAEYLMPLATEALAAAARKLAEIDAVVVGIGPGPFTGLRVGIATAAALGDALDVPVFGVPSHDAIARQFTEPECLLVVTDARRKEVYVSAYATDHARVFGPAVMKPSSVAGALSDADVVVSAVAGSGADLLTDTVDAPVLAPSGSLAVGLVECAARSLLTGAVPGPVSPLYLRRPDATAPAAPKTVLPEGIPYPQSR